MKAQRIEIFLEVWNWKGQTWKRYEIDTEGIESIPLTYNVADIKDPSITKGSFSKTIELPETDRNRQAFNDITDLNSYGTFDPGKRQRAYILTEGVLALDGYFTLTDFTIDRWNWKNTISLNVFADNNDFFSVLGEDFIETLDMSRWNHIYNSTNIAQSWLSNKTWQNGYYYPLIDYGNDWSLASLNSYPGVQTEDFKPAVYVRAIWEQIFQEAGFTWISGSLTQSTPFDNLIVPFNGKDLEPEDNYLLTRQFRAGMSVFQNITLPQTKPSININQLNQNFIPVNTIYQPVSGSQVLNEIVRFNDDTTVPNGDPGNVWSTTLWEYTNNTAYPITQKFGITLEIDQTRVWTINDVPQVYLEIFNGFNWSMVQTDESWNNTLYLPVADISNAGWQYTNPQPAGKPSPAPLGYEKYIKSFYSPNHFLGPNWKIRLRYRYNVSGNISNPILAGTVMAVIKESSFIFNQPQTAVSDGMLLVLGKQLPKQFKRKDFILSIVKMFNLVIEPDKIVKNQLRIETRDAYYAAGPIENWTRKVDFEQPVKVQILADTQTRRLNFKYKDDDDYFNKDYREKAKIGYGTYQYNTENENITGEKNVEISFSPTPIVAVPLSGGNALGATSQSNIVIPKIGVLNNAAFAKAASKPRILIKKAQVPCQQWVAFNIGQTTYPYAGHLDDPWNPDIDINYGQTLGVYYAQTTTTANTLWRTFWQSSTEETYDKFSRIVKCQMYLTPEDVYLFRFNWNIAIDFGTGLQYYKVNRISDWDPCLAKTCEVELIKTISIKVPRLVPYKINWSLVGITGIKDSGGIPGGGGSEPAGRAAQSGRSIGIGDGNSYIGDGLLMSGRNNNGSGENSLIVGDENNSDGSRQTIIGSRNTISAPGGEGNAIFGNDNEVGPLNERNFIIGERNTVQFGATSSSENIVFGSDMTISGSGGFIVKAPITQYIDFIDAGRDEIIGEFADNCLINYISAGRDAILGLSSKSLIKQIDAGRDNIL